MSSQSKAIPEKHQHASRTGDPAERALAWVEQNRRLMLGVLAVVVAVAGGAWYGVSAQVRKERFAEGELDAARNSAQLGNLALASADLDRLIATYGGTNAAEEAVLLLARIRLDQGEPALATVELRRFLDEGPSSQFLGPTWALLGASLEQARTYGEAAEAFNAAAGHAYYDFLQAQYLIDAGRNYELAGDASLAAQVYQRVLDELSETSVAVEARVRLGELRPTGPDGTT